MLNQQSQGAAPRPHETISERIKNMRTIKAYLGKSLVMEPGNPYGLTLSMDVYEEIMRQYDVLRRERRFLLLFELLFLQRTLRDTHTNLIVISSKQLAICEGKLKEYEQRHYNGEKFLVEFRDATGIDIQWTKATFEGVDEETGRRFKNKRRIITELGISDELIDRINRSTCEKNAKQVYVRTGLTHTPERVKKDYAILRDRNVKAGRKSYAVEEQRVMDEMLSAIPEHKFLTLVEAHKHEARNRLDTLKGVIGHKDNYTYGKSNQITILNGIVAQPKPDYNPADYSFRLFAGGLPLIDRRIRWELTPELYEIDLKSAHAAYASRYWGIPELYDMLSDREPLWEYLLDYLEVRHSLWYRVEPLVKRTFYGTLYGMETGRIDLMLWRLISDEFRQGERPWLNRRFSENEIIRQVLRARDREMQRVLRDGGTETPFGPLSLDVDTKHYPDGRYNEGGTLRTHLTHAASAFELKLIYPCFEVAAGRTDHDVTIMLEQHDGLSLEVRPSRLQRVLGAMRQAVGDVARQYDIPTYLKLTEKQ